MKRLVLLPLLALGAGLPGFWLRRQELAHAFEPETGFLLETVYTPALLGLSVGLAVLLVLCLWTMRFDGTYAAAFESASLLRLAALVVSAGLMAAVGFLTLGELFDYLRVFGSQDLLVLQKQLVFRAALGVCAMLCCAAVLRMAVRGFHPVPRAGRFSVSVLAPAFLSCVWMLASYQSWSADPVFLHFAYPLCGIMCCALSCISMAGFLYEKPRPRLTVLTGLMASYFFLTALADSPDGVTLLLSLALGLYLLTGVLTLLYRAAHPAVAEAQSETEESPHA